MAWSIEHYLNVRQAYGPAFRSDGRALAFLTNITGLPQVWQVPLAGADDGTPRDNIPRDMIPWPEQLTFGIDRVSEAWYVPSFGDPRLLYVEDVGGSENHQLFLLDPGRTAAVHLSAGYEKAMHLFGSWREDGRQICFAANRRDPAIFDLYVQPLDAMAPGTAELVWQNDERGYLRSIEFSPDGRRVITVRTTSSFNHTLLEIDLASGQARTLLADAENVRFSGMTYTPDGRALYLLTDLDSDTMYVARLDLETGEVDTLASPAWDCQALAVSKTGTQLAYAVNVDGADRVYVLDLANRQMRSMPDFAGAVGIVPDGNLIFSPDVRYLAFAFSSAIRTADVMLWDLAEDRICPVTQSSHGGLPAPSFVAPELIHFSTFDQDEEGETREIPAWYYKPAGDASAPLPAVVMVHGGPESQFRATFHFLIQYLLQNGYAVLAPNVRGSTGYGKAYSHLDDVEKRVDSVADLAYAARWLQAQPEIDGERLAVYGGSYGGFMVLSAVTTYPELWAAGVDIVGISNLATFLENTSDYRRAHREGEYGSLAHDREFLERIAPINHVDRITAPLMVIHGRNDPRVPVSEAERLVAALQARGIPVTLMVFEDEGHGLVKLKNKQVAYPVVVEFLKRYLGSANR